MLFAVIGQIVDFFWKAAVEYASTPTGQKELNDIIVAAGIDDATSASQASSDTSAALRTVRRSGGA